MGDAVSRAATGGAAAADIFMPARPAVASIPAAMTPPRLCVIRVRMAFQSSVRRRPVRPGGVCSWPLDARQRRNVPARTRRSARRQPREPGPFVVFALALTALVASASVRYAIRTERAGARTLAAVRATTTQQRLGADIVRLLDLVWPVLREQGVRTGHNVVVYYGAESGAMTIDAGVEALADFTEHGEVRRVCTPPGEVATTAHYGEYSDLAGAYAALEQWCADYGRRPAGVNWEVYGDWNDDPAKRRTDVYFLLKPTAG